LITKGGSSLGKNMYLESLAFIGVGGAHPGGLQLTKSILEKENPNSDLSILDAGCGTGQTAAYIAENFSCQVLALDNNKLMLDKARKRFLTLGLPIETMLGTTESLPFSKTTFDIVFSESVIAFTHISKTVSEFKRILKPQGTLYAIEMVLDDHQTSEHDIRKIKEFYGINLLTEFEWIQAFQNGGFEKINVEKYNYNNDSQNFYNAPDFEISDDIGDKYFDILSEHINLTKQYNNILGFRIFTCSP